MTVLRPKLVHLDGTSVFQSGEDVRQQREVAQEIEQAWGCTVHSYPALSPIDWFAERDGRMVGQLELRRRSCPAAQYADVFLPVAKWLALTLGAIGTGV